MFPYTHLDRIRSAEAALHGAPQPVDHAFDTQDDFSVDPIRSHRQVVPTRPMHDIGPVSSDKPILRYSYDETTDTLIFDRIVRGNA
jgi:hypothetical protein